MQINPNRNDMAKLTLPSSGTPSPRRVLTRMQALLACICVSVMCVSVFSGVIVSTAYGAGGDTDCPGNGNGNGGHNHDESVPCPGNDTGCTNQPDPDQVEDVDEWASDPAISADSDLEIDGPLVVCVGTTHLYGFERSGQANALDHGVTDEDTHTTGPITTKYKLNEDCENVIDDVVDGTSPNNEADGISYAWSVTGGGSIETNSEGYGEYTAPATGGNVTIKSTFSDTAPAVDDGTRNDTDHVETLNVKVIEVASLEPSEGEEVDTIQTGPSPGVDTDVWLVPVDLAEGATFNVVATPSPAATNEELEESGCWTLEAFYADGSGTQGAEVPDSQTDARTVTLSQQTPGSYLVIAKAGDSEKRVLVHVLKVDLNIFAVEAGDVVEQEEEADPGSFVFVNDDHDGSAIEEDRDNDYVDGEGDLLDMVKLKLCVTPADIDGLVVELRVEEESFGRLFDENQDMVVLEGGRTQISLDRLDDGPINFFAEGVSPGTMTMILAANHEDASSESADIEDTVTLTVDERPWKAWPGGMATELNPIERLTSSDLEVGGNVEWSATGGAKLFKDPNATTPLPAGEKRSSVWVRYDMVSEDATKEKAVLITAKRKQIIGGVRRTVFSIEWTGVNAGGNEENDENNKLDSANKLEFPSELGGDVDRCGIVWPAGNGGLATAKVECTATFSPSGIDWAARGVTFWSKGDPEVENALRFHREIKGLWGEQKVPKRRDHRALPEKGPDDYIKIPVPANLVRWRGDGDPDNNFDAQYPTKDEPKAFRIDAPNFDLDSRATFYLRASFHENFEWRQGTKWTQCSPDLAWHANLTGAGPNCQQVDPNESGAGHKIKSVPNEPPQTIATVDEPSDGNPKAGDLVRMKAVITASEVDPDGDPISAYIWTQSEEQAEVITLSDPLMPDTTWTVPEGLTEETTYTLTWTIFDITQKFGVYAPAADGADSYKKSTDVVITAKPAEPEE